MAAIARLNLLILIFQQLFNIFRFIVFRVAEYDSENIKTIQGLTHCSQYYYFGAFSLNKASDSPTAR